MHGIGSEADAQAILEWVRSHGKSYGRPLCALHGIAPDGWEYIGSGTFRSVWLSPEGVAYKVEHNNLYSTQSAEEVHKLGLAWEKGAPKGCRIPKFAAYYPDDNDIVIAIELIKGETLYEYACEVENDVLRNRLYGLLAECEDRFKLYDLHDENAIVDEDGLLVPVDFGG